MNLSPRAGVAWDVKGDGRLAVRSSYGLTYDYPGGEYFNNLAAAPPYGNRTLISDPSGLFDDPYRDIGGNLSDILEVVANTSAGEQGRIRQARRRHRLTVRSDL